MELKAKDHASLIESVWRGDTPRETILNYASAIGATYQAARTHRIRNSIPPDYWELACKDASRLGYKEVTHDLLQRLKRRRKNRSRLDAQDGSFSSQSAPGRT